MQMTYTTQTIGGYEMDVRSNGFISWCSDWAHIWELVRSGLVKARTSGYGLQRDTEFYLV